MHQSFWGPFSFSQATRRFETGETTTRRLVLSLCIVVGGWIATSSILSLVWYSIGPQFTRIPSDTNNFRILRNHNVCYLGKWNLLWKGGSQLEKGHDDLSEVCKARYVATLLVPNTRSMRTFLAGWSWYYVRAWVSKIIRNYSNRWCCLKYSIKRGATCLRLARAFP
jgi:hypothetical protein